MIILRRFLLRFLCRQPVIPLFLLVAGVLYMSSTWSYSGCLFSGNISRQPMEEPGEVKAMDKMDKIEESVLVNTTQKTEPGIKVAEQEKEYVNAVLQKREEDIEYFQEHDMDLPGGDLPCGVNESCHKFMVRSSHQAKLICNSYGSRCKGFVYSKQSGIFIPKGELQNKMVFTTGMELFVKKTFAESAMTNETCAVPLDQFQSLADGCHLPELDPNDESITKLIKKPETPLQCPGFQLTRYRSGVLEVIDHGGKATNISSLMYQSIFRPQHKDWGVIFGDEVSLQAKDGQFRLDSEFIRVKLTTAQGTKHVEYHAQVVPKPLPVNHRKENGLPLSVVIIGLDSLSAAHFQRALPEAYKFMKEEMNSVFLKGYSVVGDGTTPALAALMTGKFESELPEARKGYAHSQPLDRWSHIFKDFKVQGYATLFSEDAPVYAAFNYRLHGFKDPPTDHFSRYFWEAAHMTSPQCVHSKPQHQIHFDYITSFLEAYRNQPKFGLFFMSEISHNNLENVYFCADNFVALLRHLYGGNLLNDSLLIVMSDHGARVGDARVTLQGKLEERLPLMSFTFPKWFSQQYRSLIENFKENSKIVTSPFDLYATFKHVLSYPQVPANLTRGKSLLSKINKSRDCEDAGIAEHYCPCIQWKSIDTRTDHARSAAQAAVDHVNNLTASDSQGLHLCSRLQLKEILAAHQTIPNVKVAQYLGSSDVHGRKPMFSRGTATLGQCLYQIQFQTVPGNGIFEASVSLQSGIFRVTSEMSRINLYGDQPKCIVDKSPHLRKYCLCKDYKEE